jgi:hypothetical protein
MSTSTQTPQATAAPLSSRAKKDPLGRDDKTIDSQDVGGSQQDIDPNPIASPP